MLWIILYHVGLGLKYVHYADRGEFRVPRAPEIHDMTCKDVLYNRLYAHVAIGLYWTISTTSWIVKCKDILDGAVLSFILGLDSRRCRRGHSGYRSNVIQECSHSPKIHKIAVPNLNAAWGWWSKQIMWMWWILNLNSNRIQLTPVAH